MRKSKPEKLQVIVNQFIREEGLETPRNQYRIIDTWKNTVGKSFEKYTESIFIKNQKLYIKIHSSVIKQELSMYSRQLAQQLNNEVKSQVIVDIVFI